MTVSLAMNVISVPPKVLLIGELPVALNALHPRDGGWASAGSSSFWACHTKKNKRMEYY